MAVSAGPDIVENGLMLAFDGENFKSFKGEPTTNLVTDPLALAGFPATFTWSGFEATTERVSNLPHPDMYKISPFWIKIVKTSASNGRAVVYGGGGLNTGVDYYVYTNDTNLTTLQWITDNGAVSTVESFTNYTSSDRGTIKRVQTIFRSVAGNAVDVLRFGGTDPIGTTVWITGIQIEQKSYPTRIVTGTRGTTVATGGGLANLIGSDGNGELANGIREDLNNFGSLLLDGTDDHVSCSANNNIAFGSGNFTIDITLKINTVTGNQYFYDFGVNNVVLQYLPGTIRYLTQATSIKDTSFTLNASQIYNLVITRIGTTGYLFINGTQQNSWSDLETYTSNTLKLGMYGGSGFNLNGNIYAFRAYNRGLSAEEILQNFNALRGRFNI